MTASNNNTIHITQEEYSYLRTLSKHVTTLTTRLEAMEAKEASRNVSSAGVVTSANREPRMADPDFFNGKRSTTRAFLTQVRMVLAANPSRFPDETSKILYASSFMRGSAFVWLQPFIEKSSVHPFLQNFEKFSDAILNQFGDTDAEIDAERNIYMLKQTSSVSSYVAEFKTLASRLKWNDAAYRAQFYRGLKDNIKDELCKVERPISLDSLIDLCIKLDNRLHERRLEKGTIPFSPAVFSKQHDSNAMELDSVTSIPRGRLSDEEKHRRRRLNLCQYCGSSRHSIDECSLAQSRSNGHLKSKARRD